VDEFDRVVTELRRELEMNIEAIRRKIIESSANGETQIAMD
jgi:hypothetical protein